MKKGGKIFRVFERQKLHTFSQINYKYFWSNRENRTSGTGVSIDFPRTGFDSESTGQG